MLEEEKLTETKVLREAKKFIKRKVPGFKEKLTTDDIRNNPFICVMFKTALSKPKISLEERYIIRKVTRAIFSFVDGKIIDELLPIAADEERDDPTPMEEVVKQLKEQYVEKSRVSEYEHKEHLLIFAYLVALEDGHFEEKEKFINELALTLHIKKKEQERIKKTVKHDFSAGGIKREGNIYRNIMTAKKEVGEEFKGSKLKALVQMFAFMKDYKKLYIWSLVLLAVMCIIISITPAVNQYIIDNVFAINDYSKYIASLVMLALFGLGLRVFAGAFNSVRQRFSVRSVESASRDLKDRVYNHLMHLPFSYYDKNKTGETLSICTSDIHRVASTFMQITPQLVRILVTLFSSLGLMIYYDLEFALISIITFPVVWFISYLFFRKESSTYEVYQEQEARLSGVLQENLTGVRVVKAFARQEFEKEKFDKENRAKYKHGKRLMSIHALFWPTTDVLGALQLSISIIAGAVMAINGEITTGIFVAFVQYLFMIIWPMKILGRNVIEFGKASVSWKRINFILNAEPEDINTGYTSDAKLKGEIEFKNVYFAYEHGNPVLKDFNLKIKAGEKVAIIGGTGSGKSTVLNLLSGFYPINSGEILVDGRNINEYAKTYLNDQIGFTHQEGFLFSRSIKDNIAFARKGATDEDIIESAKMADIHESIMRFPDGYETMVGEKGVTLSGGQKQRITIARTLLKDPAILILDDSLSAVDTETEAKIQSSLEKVMENRTSIIIGHRVTSAMKADKIVVLRDGNIVQQGTHDELVEQEGIYKSIFNIQTKIEEEIEKEVSGV